MHQFWHVEEPEAALETFTTMVDVSRFSATSAYGYHLAVFQFRYVFEYPLRITRLLVPAKQ